MKKKYNYNYIIGLSRGWQKTKDEITGSDSFFGKSRKTIRQNNQYVETEQRK